MERPGGGQKRMRKMKHTHAKCSCVTFQFEVFEWYTHSFPNRYVIPHNVSAHFLFLLRLACCVLLLLLLLTLTLLQSPLPLFVTIFSIVRRRCARVSTTHNKGEHNAQHTHSRTLKQQRKKAPLGR